MTVFGSLSILSLILTWVAGAPQPPILASGAGTAITRFHVNTKIQMRYAVTDVETQVKNKDLEVQEVAFDMFIPNEAFVSNFSMVIKDKTYVAKVDEKEQAEETFSNSQTSSGLVQQFEEPTFTDGKRIRFTAKIDPADKVIFRLRYEELLERSDNGKYKYVVNVQPQNQKIPDFKIKIALNESLPLKDVAVKRVKTKDEISSKAEDITDETLEFDEKVAPNQAVIELSPNDAKNNGQDWQFVLNYDVERQNDNQVQIGAGKFVHYFAPDQLPTVPKHIIFVIDVSGSMAGRKLAQTKDAMTTMLDKMSEQNLDSFNILAFSDDIEHWQNNSETYSIPDNDGDVSQAYEYVLGLTDLGGTNINDALIEALEVARRVKQAEIIPSKSQQMIVFLTDGQPSTGVTDNELIKDNVKELNAELKVPIYGLAFGNGADFNLIKDISDDSNAFATRIYESGNSFEQLETFYNQISDPKLNNVKFQYLVNGERKVTNLTANDVGIAFGANEYVIVGDLDEIDEEINDIEIVMTFDDEQGQQQETIKKILPCALPFYPNPLLRPYDCFPRPQVPVVTIDWVKTPAEAFLERLWGFKRINFLLDDNCEEKSNNETDCQEEALVLALKFNFVTDITSMVVEEDDDYVTKGLVGGVPDLFRNYDYGSAYFSSGGYSPNSFGSAHFSAGGFSPNSFVATRNRVAMPAVFSGNAFSANASPPKRFNKRPTASTTTPSGIYFPSSDYDYDLEDAYIYPDPQPATTTTTTSTTTTPPEPCKVTLYSQTHYRGETVDIVEEVPELSTLNFDNEVASMKIEGTCCWTFFTEANYTGESFDFTKGDFKSATDIVNIFKKASSVKQCK